MFQKDRNLGYTICAPVKVKTGERLFFDLQNLRMDETPVLSII